MRDTDADWKQIGDTDPYWGVYTCDLCKIENLTMEVVERLYRSGINDVRRFRRTFQRYFGSDFKPRTALDFGCGVGRLVLATAPHVECVVGVDVAPGMPQTRIAAILNSERSVTDDTALRLGRSFDVSAKFWLGLQEQYDLDRTRLDLGQRIEAEVKPLAMA